MQPLKGRKVLFGAIAVLACSGDPTGNESIPTAITTSADVVFVTQGDSQPVIASVVDEDGQIIQSDINTGTVGGGITVVEDPTFLTVNSGTPIARQHRFFVKGDELAATSFTLEAFGLTKTVQVTSVPGNLRATISNLTPLLGDTISITAPANTFFTETSVLTLDGVPPQVVSQDASTIVFIPFPNVTAPAVVSDVGVTSNPNLVFTLSTPDTIRTDSIVDVGGNVSPTTPALGATVTLTLPEELRVIPESLPNLTLAGSELPPQNILVSPDSLTITFTPPPNVDSVVVVPGVVARRLPQYPLELPTAVKITTPVVDTVPSTVSSATPAGGAPVTLSITNPAFTFSQGTEVTVGGLPAITVSVAADGSSLSFVPTPGSTGPLTVTPVTIVGFPLTLVSNAGTVTAGATVTPIPGTGSPGTAPAFPLPAPGTTRGIVDGKSYGYTGCGDILADLGVEPNCQVYELTVPTDQTLDFEAVWSSTQDVGIYFIEADGITDTGAHDCDALGVIPVSQPEICSVDFAAGTYYVAVVPVFEIGTPQGPGPDWVRIRVTAP